jgi:hypothetical protein
VEKLIALPRRLAMHLADPAKREFDSTLVRHLFDVYAIVNRMPDTNQTESLKPLLLIAMDKDARDFSSQHPQFLTNPIEEMKKAMRVARDNVVYKICMKVSLTRWFMVTTSLRLMRFWHVLTRF